MRILLVKTSSLGDVIHNLPVASDIRQAFPNAEIDWCVESAFADIPRLHPAVSRVIPVAIRSWRKQLFQRQTWFAMADCQKALRQTPYDWIIDTQGLIKSALITRLAEGRRAGYSRDVVREPWAAHAYDAHFFVPKTLHAIERNRRLAGAALGYVVSPELHYGIHATAPLPRELNLAHPKVVLLTASSREDKRWPDDHWIELGKSLHMQGLCAYLPAGNAHERERAAFIAQAIPEARLVPPLSLSELASLLASAAVVVGVDTGLTHLAAALNKPTVALYTASDPGLTGVVGSGGFRNLGGHGQSPKVKEVFDVCQSLCPPLPPLRGIDDPLVL